MGPRGVPCPRLLPCLRSLGGGVGTVPNGLPPSNHPPLAPRLHCTHGRDNVLCSGEICQNLLASAGSLCPRSMCQTKCQRAELLILYNAAKIRPRGCDQSFILLKPKNTFLPLTKYR